MPTITTISTNLLESVNIVLANLGEAPLPANGLSNALPQQASLALDTIQEVSNDIQSKGWWFNQKSGSDYDPTANVVVVSNTSTNWHTDIPEEARRYITIRAARIAQTRFIGSEELQKFSYNEELVSLAILQQAHVRNSNGVLDFTSFPSELRSLGVDEIMFLQGNVEEKIGTLRLGGELANIAKTKAETELLADQEALVEQQLSTEEKETAKREAEKDLLLAQEFKVDAETALIADQEALVEQQLSTEVEETAKRTAEKNLLSAQELKVDAEKLLVDAQELKTDAETALTSNQSSLVASQKTQLDAQTAIEATAEKDFYDGVVAGTQNTYRDYAAELRIMGVQETAFQQTPAYKKIELLSDASKMRTATATETGTDATELSEVNKVMRFIGETQVTALNSNSLASECVRLLRDTDAEMQGRGWWFNTETDVELTLSNNRLVIPSDALSVELNDYSTRIITVNNLRYVYNLKEKSYTSWNKEEKAKVIYQRALNDTPSKYREYLSVRVAILLTELYPQSGVDIQRLPKMEQELRAYFKSREADDANYSIFDNYDTASRVGINRNYNIS